LPQSVRLQSWFNHSLLERRLSAQELFQSVAVRKSEFAPEIICQGHDFIRHLKFENNGPTFVRKQVRFWLSTVTWPPIGMRTGYGSRRKTTYGLKSMRLLEIRVRPVLQDRLRPLPRRSMPQGACLGAASHGLSRREDLLEPLVLCQLSLS